MEYQRLGNTGLEVSRICLGCMSYGQSNLGTHEWSLDEETSRPFFKQALDLGINFFDTANVYSLGTSEEYLGRALRDLDVPRSDVVIATKVNGRMRKAANGAGLSRKAIMTEIDDSLRRLGTDYIDLYQIHRWDPKTPIEETMETLNDLVRSGKVRYLGASSMWAWQFATAQHVAERNGWTQFVSMQNHYNLLMREEEREMLPYCEATGVGVIPWSPLARGRLTRTWETSTGRSETDVFGSGLYGRDVTEQSDRDVVSAVAEIAANRGTSMARVALAWVLSNPTVTAPIVGATRASHLDDAVAALDIELSADELERLTSPYIPHQPAGF
ncbi:MAG: aldo/keto reductase [Ilumatobacteraceae bacterium]|jgi:aryl-alcohol dehydrogenase-like predicted oxidoreductase